ncbi:unnamed protein product [Linum trigynum]|uniref:Uncharacterized protein n=1 Tax=Linum trigynum TaxID=586398 RepID=A0AAV2FS41_9ROSI
MSISGCSSVPPHRLYLPSHHCFVLTSSPVSYRLSIWRSPVFLFATLLKNSSQAVVPKTIYGWFNPFQVQFISSHF